MLALLANNPELSVLNTRKFYFSLSSQANQCLADGLEESWFLTPYCHHFLLLPLSPRQSPLSLYSLSGGHGIKRICMTFGDFPDFFPEASPDPSGTKMGTRQGSFPMCATGENRLLGVSPVSTRVVFLS